MRMDGILKRALSTLLVCALLIGMLPQIVVAQDTNTEQATNTTTELITNGGFETLRDGVATVIDVSNVKTDITPAGWEMQCGSNSTYFTVTADTTAGRNGGTAVKLERLANDAKTTSVGYLTLENKVAVEANAAYLLSVWVKPDAAVRETSVRINPRVTGTNVKEQSSSVYTNGMLDGWQQIFCHFVARTADQVTVQLYVSGMTTGYILVDDVSLIKLGTANTLPDWNGSVETAILDTHAQTNVSGTYVYLPANSWKIKPAKIDDTVGTPPVKAVVQSSDARTGTNAIKLYAANQENGGRHYLYYAIPEGAYTANTTYHLSAWVKGVQGEGAKGTYGAIKIDGKDVNNQNFPSVTLSAASDWTKISGYKTSGASGEFEIVLNVSNPVYDGYWLVDDLLITKDGEAESITLDKTSVVLKEGEFTELVYNLVKADTDDALDLNADGNKVTYSSSNTSVATVDSTTGKVTAVAEGKAIITATTGNGRTAGCLVTVSNMGENLLTNGDFENDTAGSVSHATGSTNNVNTVADGWKAWAGSDTHFDVTIEENSGRNGSQAVAITHTTGYTSETARGDFKTTLTVEKGYTYLVSAWVNLDGAQDTSVRWYATPYSETFGKGIRIDSVNMSKTTGTGWQRVCLCFAAEKSETLTLTLYFTAIKDGNKVLIDDVSAAKIGPAGTNIDWNGGVESAIAKTAVELNAGSGVRAYLPAYGWYMYPAESNVASGVEIVNTGAKTGNYALKLHAIDTEAGAKPGVAYRLPEGKFEYGQEYIVSVWVKTVAGTSNSGTAKIRLCDANGNGECVNFADASEWTQLTTTFTAPANDTATDTQYFEMLVRPDALIYDGYILVDDLTITKVVNVAVEDVAIEDATMQVGTTHTLVPTFTPANATNQNVSYESSNPAVAAVDASGVVTAYKVGTATITVTTEDGNKTDTCVITVDPNLVINGDFETGTAGTATAVTNTANIFGTGWRANGMSGSADYALTAGVGWNNSKAIQIKANTASSRAEMKIGVEVEANAVYYASAWVKIDSDQTGGVNLYVDNGPLNSGKTGGSINGGKTAGTGASYTSSKGQWVPISVSFTTVNAGEIVLAVYCSPMSTTGDITVDNVSLVKVSDSYGTTADWNGGFESALVNSSMELVVGGGTHHTVAHGWRFQSASETSGAVVVTGTVHSGTNAMKLYSVDTTKAAKPYISYVMPAGSLEAETAYDVALWVKGMPGTGSNKNSGSIRIVGGTAGAEDVKSYSLTNAAEWVKISSRFMSDANGALTLNFEASGLYDGYFLIDDLTVTKVVNIAVEGVSIEDATMQVGTTHTLVPTFTPANATNQNVSYESSNPAVAAVDANTGVVTAYKVGTATITVTTEDGNKTDTCVITVDPNLVINGDLETGTVGDNQEINATTNNFKGTGWTVYGTDGSLNYKLAAGVGRDGSKAMQIQAKSFASGKTAARGYMQKTVTVEANSVYFLTAWVKIDGTQGGSVNLYAQNAPVNAPGNKASGSGVGYAATAGEWTQITTCFSTLNAGEIVVAAYFGSLGTNGYITVDDVSLVKVGDALGTTADWNGGFESAIVNSPMELAAGGGTRHTVACGWQLVSLSETSGVVVLQGVAHSGTNAMKLYSVDTTKAAKPYISYVMPAGRLEAETTYEVSLWVKGVPGTGSNKNSGSIRLVSGADGAVAGDVISYNLTNAADWVKISSRFAAKNDGSLTLNFEASGLYDGYFLIDDLTLTEVVHVPVESVTIEDATMKVGATHTLVPVINPDTATNQNVSYESSNPAVATVNANGVVTALKVGSATITVTTEDGSKTDTCVITVDSNLLPNDDFELGNAGTVTSEGSNVNTNATGWKGWAGDQTHLDFSLVEGAGRDGSKAIKIGRNANYTANNARGYLTTINRVALEANTTYEFSAWIKACDGVTGNINIYVNGENTGKIGKVMSEYVDISDMGENTWYQLKYIFTTRDVAENITAHVYVGHMNVGYYLVDDLSLVKINDYPVEKLELNTNSMIINVGNTENLVATVTPSYALDRDVTFVSSNPSVATVDATGKVTALAVGTTTITAIAGGKMATCTVEVDPYDPNLVLNGYFERGSTDVFTIVAGNSTANTNVTNWKGWAGAGSMSFQKVLEGRPTANADTSYAMKVFRTPDTATVSRGEMIQTIPADKVEAGKCYKLTMWVKSVGMTNNGTAWIQYAHKNSTFVKLETMRGKYIDQWTQVVTYIEGEGKDLTVYFKWEGLEGGYYLIDNVVLEPWVLVDEVTLPHNKFYMEPGDTANMAATLTPAVTSDDTIHYSSTDETVVTVDENGQITAVGTGIATITATAANGGKFADCEIYVVDSYVPLTALNIPASLNLVAGSQAQLNLTFNPTNASDQAVTWTSGDEAVAVVTKNGLVTALSAGTATITVTGENGISAQCTVTVTQSTTLTSALAQFTTGYGQKLTGNLSASVTNNTGAAATYTIYQAPANGYMVLNADGSFTYVPKSNFDISQPDTFTALVSAGTESTLINGVITVESIVNNIRENVTSGMTLMTTQEQLEYIRAEIAKEGSLHNELWQRVKKDVDKIMTAPIPQYDQYTSDENYWAMWQRPVGTQIATLLFGALISENETYKEKTIQYAVTSANYDTWAEWEYYQQADLAAGHQGYAIALVFNWLHDDMTQQQRDDIIRRLYQTCERVENKWGDSTQFMQNHMWVALSALNASSLALYVYPEEVAAAVSQIEGYESITAAQVKENCERWIALCAQKIGRSFEVMPSDGTNHEGPGYHSYGLEYLLKNAILLNDSVGIDMFTNNQWLQNNSEYLLNIMVPAGDLNGSVSAIDYANSIRGFWYGPSMLYRTLAAIYNDGTAQWIAEIFEDTNSDCSGSSLWMSLLYADPSVEAVSPADQVNKSTLWYADDMDIVVSRTNWTGNEAMVFMRCGLPLGKTAYELISGSEHINSSNEAHSDPDDNGLILFYNGEFLLKTDGVTYKYTGNFSTLMVDGVGQLGTERDVISGFKDADFIKYDAKPYMKKTESTATYDYFVGDATEAYNPTLGIKKFERNVVLLKEENVLLVVDNIITTNDESNLELRWFPESKTISEGFGIYTIYGNKNDMKFFPFTTEGVTTEFKELGVYADAAAMTTEKAFQQLKTGSKWQNAVAFSWSAKEEEQAMVRYMAGDSHKHLFEVNGKIYTVDVRNNTVSVATGALDVVDPWASNSELSEILFGGIAMEGFQSDTLTYIMEKNWKTEEVELMPIAKSPTAEIEVDWDGSCPGTIEITCTSQDGTSVSNYVITLTNNKGLLSIHSASSDKNVSVPIECTYDNYLQTKGSDRTWASTGLPTVIYDMGRLVDISRIDIAFNYSDRRDTYYDFYTSIDGEEWTLIQKDGIALRTAADGPRNDYRTVAEDVGQARYLKFYLRGNSTGKQGPNGDGWDDATAYNSIQEISIYGTEVEADIMVEETTATVTGTGMSNALAAAGNKNEVVLDVESVDDSAVKVVLPVEQLKDVAEAEKDLVIQLSQATVTLDNDALAAITTAAGKKPTVELTVVPVDEEDLEAKQVEALKDYDVAMTFAITLVCDGQTISTFGSGAVTVRIPFTPAEGTLASEYRIAYIADDGKIEILETVAGDGYLEVTLEHFSEYAIARIQEKVPATGDMQLPLMMLAVLTVSLLAALAVLVMKRKNYC